MATEIYDNLNPKKKSHLDERLITVATYGDLPDPNVNTNFIPMLKIYMVFIICSMNIFNPITMRIIPPKISILRLRNIPILLPSVIPIIVKAAATNPIMTLGYHIATFSTPRLMPTAKASILVAIDRYSSVTPLVGSHGNSDFEPFPKASKIIFPPIKPKSVIAIQ